MFTVGKKAYFRVIIEPSQADLFPNIVMSPRNLWNTASEYFITKKLQGLAEYLFQIKLQNSL